MSLPKEIKEKLTNAGVSEEAIKILEEQCLDTEASLLEVTKEELKEVGIKKLGDRNKIKGSYPAQSETAAPAAAGENAVSLVEAMKQMGTQLVQGLTAADREVCGNCSKVMAKDFSGSNCTGCGMPLKTKITCLNCHHENSEVKEGDFCAQCSTPLVSGGTRQKIVYLMRVRGFQAVGPAMTELNRIKGNEGELKILNAQVDAWVNDGGYADVATIFRRRETF